MKNAFSIITSKLNEEYLLFEVDHCLRISSARQQSVCYTVLDAFISTDFLEIRYYKGTLLCLQVKLRMGKEFQE